MKTKFILYGGFTPENKQENNNEFHKEVLKDAPENPKILLVCFAKNADRIPIATARVMSELNEVKWQKELVFDISKEESFIEQIQSADIVYLQGGNTLKLIDILKKFQGLKELFKGKIVAGDSAGANVLGVVFYSPSANGVFEGLGILPLKIIPHYSEKYKDVFNDIKLDLENLYLKEYELKVFELDL